MIYQHLEIISSLEKEGDEYYLVRTIKSQEEIVYHSRVNAESKAANENPITDLENFISQDLTFKKTKSCCNRCRNSCYISDSICQSRINLFGKFRQLIIKFLKICP